MFAPVVELGFVTSEEFVLSVDSAFVTSAVELNFASSAELNFVLSVAESLLIPSVDFDFVTLVFVFNKGDKVLTLILLSLFNWTVSLSLILNGSLARSLFGR